MERGEAVGTLSFFLLLGTIALDVGLQDMLQIELSSEAQYTLLYSYILALIGLAYAVCITPSQVVPRTV